METAAEPAKPGTWVSESARAEDLAASSVNWPSFRGTAARGLADGQHPPVRWDVPAAVNVRWKTSLPGLGHSSPIVWGDRVFVTTAVSTQDTAGVRTGLIVNEFTPLDDKSPHAWQVFCLDKQRGTVVWQQTAHEGAPRFKRHPKSTHANPTPATDGEHVVAFFASEGLYCYDLDGRLLWNKSLGDLNSGWFYDADYEWGFGSSPIIYRDLVIVQCDIQQGSFLAAFDVTSGELRWRRERDEIPTWATPTVCEGPSGPMLVTNGSRFARGYDPLSGEELWRLAGHSEISVPTPFSAGSSAFVCSGYRPVKPIYAVRLDAQGDITLNPGETSNAFLAWSNLQGGPYLPTPIVYRDCLTVCNDSGVLTCYDAKTGRRHYQERVRDGGAKSFAASLVAADDRIY